MKTIKAISTVIELKPEKKYLLVFSGENPIGFERMDRFIRQLRLEGITGIGLALKKGQQIEVVEVEEEEKITYEVANRSTAIK